MSVSVNVSRYQVSGVGQVFNVTAQTTTVVVTVGQAAGPPSDKYYEHSQLTPSMVWNVQHNLGKRPSVSIVLNDGRVIDAAVQHVDNNNLNISFNSAATGSAHLN